MARLPRRERSATIVTIAEWSRPGLGPLKLEVYWPESNDEPLISIGGGKWLKPADLSWLQNELVDLNREIHEMGFSVPPPR